MNVFCDILCKCFVGGNGHRWACLVRAPMPIVLCPHTYTSHSLIHQPKYRLGCLKKLCTGLLEWTNLSHILLHSACTWTRQPLGSRLPVGQADAMHGRWHEKVLAHVLTKLVHYFYPSRPLLCVNFTDMCMKVEYAVTCAEWVILGVQVLAVNVLQVLTNYIDLYVNVVC